MVTVRPELSKGFPVSNILAIVRPNVPLFAL